MTLNNGGSLQDRATAADDFAAGIVRTLAEHPEFLQHALTAVSRGMQDAIRKAEARAAQADQATLAVMALSAGRVGKDLRETLLARVAAAIHPLNQCGYERGYIDSYAQAIEAQSAKTAGLGPQDESAVAESDAPENPPISSKEGTDAF